MDALSDHNLLGKSRCFLEAIDHLIRFAKTDATLLIEGETGTGKEIAARAAHEFSSRQGKPFIPVNCGALPESLAESELFGSEKGAYTDAKHTRNGLVMEAHNGTLFLDEVEAMPPKVQVALLRFLQDRSFRPVGSMSVRYSNVRIIAATNMSLERLAKNSEFRSDLIFRLNVLPVQLPALRDRGDDVILLGKAILHRFCKQYSLPEPTLSKATESWFKRYDWPGNVRELENIVLRGLFLCKGDVLDVPLPAGLSDVEAETLPLGADTHFSIAKAAAIVDFELHYLTRVLHQSGGNVTQAAMLSGTDRSAFRKLLRRHKLSAEPFRLKSQA